MLHAKSQSHRPSGSGEEYLKALTIYVRDAHFSNVTKTICIDFG